jgi:hypothetical protein
LRGGILSHEKLKGHAYCFLFFSVVFNRCRIRVRKTLTGGRMNKGNIINYYTAERVIKFRFGILWPSMILMRKRKSNPSV